MQRSRKNRNRRASNKVAEMLPGFDDDRRRTERVIPVIVLTPVK
jgi:hypothetical protein